MKTTTTPETHSTGNLTFACVRPLDDKGDAADPVRCDIFEGHIACDHSIDAAFAFCGWLDVFFDAADPHWIHYDWDAADGKFCRTRCQISYCCDCKPYKTYDCLEYILEAVKSQRALNRTNRETKWTRPEHPLRQRITAERLAELRGIGNADDAGNDDSGNNDSNDAARPDFNVDIDNAGASLTESVRSWLDGWLTGYCNKSGACPGPAFEDAIERHLTHALNFGDGPSAVMKARSRPRTEFWIVRASTSEPPDAAAGFKLSLQAKCVDWPATATA